MASIVSVKRKKGIIYYISYRVQGKQIKYRCNSDEDAKRRLPDIQVAEREQREYVSYESTSNNSNATTVSELIAAYLAHHTKELSASTVSNYHGISEHYIIPYIGKLNLNRVSTAVLQRYYDDLPNHPAVQGNHKTPAGNISARTVREVHKILRPAFRLAVKLGWMVANPATELELPSTETFVRTQWSEDEVMSFIASCKEDDVALAVAIMFFGTMRSGELCGLTWDCVNVIGEPDRKSVV